MEKVETEMTKTKTKTKTKTETKRPKKILVSGFLILISIVFINSQVYGDLGLSSEDFGSKRVSGKRVTGAPLVIKSDNTSPAADQEGSSEGQPGTESPLCSTDQGNAASESKESTCETDQCVKVASCSLLRQPL